MGTIDRGDDTIAPFSSRGPTAIDRSAKPDLVAPGVGIESLSVPNSTLSNTRSAYLLPGTVPTSFPPYLSLSGTSMATPVVTGAVALMLQANPALAPNAVKALLQFTAEAKPAYDVFTQGAGFLNAQGAVELARFLAAPFTTAYPADAIWTRQLIWGNELASGGRLTADANAWTGGTLWGAMTSGSGAPVVWGVICSVNCDDGPGAWDPWSVAGTSSTNVVWGLQCGGSDCPTGTPWSRSTVEGTTVVWGTDDEQTVVWGTTDDETVVWGTTCSDSSCEPVIWPTP